MMRMMHASSSSSSHMHVLCERSLSLTFSLIVNVVCIHIFDRIQLVFETRCPLSKALFLFFSSFPILPYFTFRP